MALPENLRRLRQFITAKRQFQQVEYEFNKTRRNVEKLRSDLRKKQRALSDKATRRAATERLFNRALESVLLQPSIAVSSCREFEIVIKLKDDHGWRGSIEIVPEAKRSDKRKITSKADAAGIHIQG